MGGSGYLVGATTTPGVQLHALRLLADNKIQYICPSPHRFDVRVGSAYLVVDAAQQVIATEGQVLDVLGATR